jgi:hypothetical protein
MSDLKGLIIPFLIGGSVITGVKFMATHLNNPALAAILGGIPTGLISIYFLTSDKSIGYAYDYFYVTLILATAILAFYLIHIHTKLDKNVVLAIALATWVVLVLIRYFFVSGKQNKNK